MGNPILRDDAIGIRLATEMHRRLRDRDDLTFVDECSVGGLNLLEIIAGFDRMIIFDAMQTGSAPIGYWVRFDAASLRPTLNLASVHDANFATALELGRRLGHHLPADEATIIFAVEVADVLTFDSRMSPELEACFAQITDEIFAEVVMLVR
jgi:hydrogenase maturation protease